jgi:hypothetical protein
VAKTSDSRSATPPTLSARWSLLLQAKGWWVDGKRVERLWRADGHRVLVGGGRSD